MMNYDNELEENKAPFGSLEEEVADDIPVMLSEGEYVIPADVVRYWGLKHLEEMRMMAKCGLMSMQQDGRLHMVDEDGEPVETEEPKAPQIEVVEIDIQAMQDDMSDQEKEDEDDDDDDMDKQMELFDDVDFDGKDEEDILKLEVGGDVQRDVENAIGIGIGNATLNISPDLMSRSLGQIGAISPTDAKTQAMTTETLSSTASNLGRDAQRDLAGAIVGNAIDDANKVDTSITGNKAIDTAIGLGSMVAAGKSPFSPTDVVTSKSVSVFSDPVTGRDIISNIGSGVVQQTAARMALTELVDIGLSIAKGVQNPNDLGVVGGQVVGVSLGNIAGVPTQSLTGTVPTEMSVDDFDRAVAGRLGKDFSTVGTNPTTGRPDFDVAKDLIGVDRDPDTGMATTGGYNEEGNYQDMLGNISAMGTAKDFLGMDISAQLDVMGKRGVGTPLGIGKSIADSAIVDSIADLEKGVDEETQETQEMMDMMSDDETLGEVENDPETEEGQDQQAEE